MIAKEDCFQIVSQYLLRINRRLIREEVLRGRGMDESARDAGFYMGRSSGLLLSAGLAS